jgi:pimeloyl-ACP methyl ester carboxylesterase
MNFPAPQQPRGNAGSANTGYILRLSDGRQLAYAQYGRPDGQPVMYCHGFPSSRLEAALFDAVARACGARLIAADRPGYGLSDFKHDRRIVDWSDDVRELSNYLGIERFALLGISGGAPYAVACASRMPDRITRLGIVCGLYSLADPDATAGMAMVARRIISFMQIVPAMARAGYARVLGPFLRIFPRTVLALLNVDAPEADRKVLAEVGLREMYVAAFREAFRQSGRGAAWDLYLYTRSWEVDPAAVRTATCLWHGEGDRTVPVAHGRRYARIIPDCHAKFLPDEGHFSLPVRHASAIIRTLAS